MPTSPMKNNFAARGPKYSAADKSHEHYTTAKVGQIVPLLCDELLPNESVSLGALANVSMIPFAADFNGKIDFRMQAFFVPYRLLWDGWKSFAMRQNQYNPDSSVPASVPYIGAATAADQTTLASFNTEEMANHTIWSRIGVGPVARLGEDNVNALNVLAYYKVWDDYFRDPRIQKACFDRSASTSYKWSHLPWTYDIQTTSFAQFASGVSGNTNNTFANGVRVGEIMQCNYDNDYFSNASTKMTNALASAAGDIYAESEFDPESLDDAPVTTISALRAANTFTRFYETLADIGNDYALYNKVMYGCYPDSEKCLKSVYLGSTSKRIYANSVYNTASTSNLLSDDSRNPLASIQGAQTSNPSCSVDDSLVDRFTTSEAGVLLVVGEIVPILPYSTASLRFNNHTAWTSFGNCRFASLGKQPIFSVELTNTYGATRGDIFGYTDRYSEYHIGIDRCTGGFADGCSYDCYAPKRGFDDAPALNTAFRQIPTTALDEVSILTDEALGTLSSHRLNVGFEYHVSLPLPEYSIPTLCEDDNEGEMQYHKKNS